MIIDKFLYIITSKISFQIKANISFNFVYELNLRSDISVWTPQGKLPISCSKAYNTLTPDYDDNVEDIVADLSDIKSDIKNISKILLQAYDQMNIHTILFIVL